MQAAGNALKKARDAARNLNREGAANARQLSQRDAEKEAGEWLGRFKLGRDLTGKTVDLSTQGDTIPFTGVFRRMVLQAAEKKLKKRGAREIILPQ